MNPYKQPIEFNPAHNSILTICFYLFLLVEILSPLFFAMALTLIVSKKSQKSDNNVVEQAARLVKSFRCKACKYEGMRRTCVYRLRYKLAFYEVDNVTIPQSGALINRSRAMAIQGNDTTIAEAKTTHTTHWISKAFTNLVIMSL